MKRLFTPVVTTILFSVSIQLQAQTLPTKYWDKTFGSNTSDYLRSVVQTSDGGYILGGYTDGGISGDKSQNSKGNNDYWIVKTDGLGNKLWDKSLGGLSYDNFYAIQQTSDGGYLLGGASGSSISGDKSQPLINGNGGSDFWVIKLDNNGIKQWDKTFGGREEDIVTCLLQTSDGGYIIGGHSRSAIHADKTQGNFGPANTYDFWVIKLTSNGTKQWDKTFGGDSNENLFVLRQTADGGYLLGGSSSSGISGVKSQANQGPVNTNDAWLVKLDVNGNKLWDKTYGGTGSEGINSLEITSNGEFVFGSTSDSGISGDKSQASKGGNDYWLVKVDVNGNKLWDKTFGGSSQDQFSTLTQTPGGGFLLGGRSQSGISGDKSNPNLGPANTGDFWLVKVDDNGSKMWDLTFGGTSEELNGVIHGTSDGGFILGGTSDSPIGAYKSQASRGAYDYWILKLTPELLGTKEEIFSDLDLYPNPTNGLINLKLSQKQADQVTVYNALGQGILTKNLVETEERDLIQLDLTKQPKGIYTIQIIAGNQSVTKKIILQ